MKLVAAILTLLVSLSTTLAYAQAPPDHHGVQNVVVIFQENRSPDNLFGSNPYFLPGVDIATSGVNSHGQQIPLTAVPLANNYDLSHAHAAFVAMYARGKMNGANKIPVSCERGVLRVVRPPIPSSNMSTIRPGSWILTSN